MPLLATRAATDLGCRPATDAELVAASLAGDSGAFSVLARRHRPAVEACCRHLLRSGSDVDDAMQDTLLRAWRRLGTYQGRSTFGWWLRTIATNTCIEHIRRRERSRDLVHALDGEPHPGPGRGGAEVTDLAAVLADREAVERAYLCAVRSLPERQCAVLVLRAVLRFSAAETAALLDCSVPAVNSALQRATATLTARRPTDAGAGAVRPTPAERALVRRLIDAQVRADPDAIVASLLRTGSARRSSASAPVARERSRDPEQEMAAMAVD